MSEEYKPLKPLEKTCLFADINEFDDYSEFEFLGLRFHVSANYRPFSTPFLKMRLLARRACVTTMSRRRTIWLKFGVKMRGEIWPRWDWSDRRSISDFASGDNWVVLQSLETSLRELHPPVDVVIFVVGEAIEERKSSEDDKDRDDERAKVIFFPTHRKWIDLDFLNRVETYYPPYEQLDVAIRVQHKMFLAHWKILSSQSPVLSAMFSSTMAERSNGYFSVEDCDPEEFQNLLVFIYSSLTPRLSKGNVMGTYYLGDKYGLPELCKHCALFIGDNLNVDDICDVFRLAIMHSDIELFKSAMAFFCENAIDIFRMRQWKRFVDEHSDEADKIYKKAIASL